MKAGIGKKGFVCACVCEDVCVGVWVYLHVCVYSMCFHMNTHERGNRESSSLKGIGQKRQFVIKMSSSKQPKVEALPTHRSFLMGHKSLRWLRGGLLI